MAQPTTRILRLLELLQAHPRLTGSELAERLEVDPRTVRRYAGHLADLGIPVVAERGRHGGYRLLPGFKLPPLMLTDDEASAVVLGLVAARALGLATTTSGPAAASAHAKIHRVLPTALRERIAAVPDTVGLTLSPREGQAPETVVVLTLAVAAHQQRRVQLRYRSYAGADSERALDPYGLVVHSGRWYVSGHDHLRDEVRTFRLDRVAAATLTGERFERPADVDPVAHVTRGLARVPYAHEVEVVLDAAMADVRRRIPPTVASLTETADGVVMHTRAERLDGMARMLAGLGWTFVVRRPAALREAVAELARSLLDSVGTDRATP